jgi:hypothetical protein
MAALNKFLAVLILLAAGGALGLSFGLYKHRTELRNRGELLADTLSEVVKELDVASGTTVGSKLNRGEYAAADNKTYGGGTLGWAAYHDKLDANGDDSAFKGDLKMAETQAQKIREQRDALATGLSDTAALFGKDDIELTAFQNVNSYAESVDAVQLHLNSVNERDKALISKIEELAFKIKHDMEKGALNDLENFSGPLQGFSDKVTGLQERSEVYADTIEQITTKIDRHEFEMNEEMVADEVQYVAEMTALLNDFNNINEKLKEYEKNKLELLETKDNLEKTIESLEDANENVAQLEDKLANVEADLKVLEQKLASVIGGPGGSSDSVGQLVKQGTVVDVNYDWNYVIIDIGGRDNLPPKLELMVAREKEFICKVLVTNVFPDYAVAEILPDLKQGEVIEGDRVFF